MALFELLAKIKIEGAQESVESLKKIDRHLVENQRGLTALGSTVSAQGSVMRSVFASLTVAASAMAVGITAALGKTALNAAADYDSLVRGLATVAKGSQDLEAQLGRLQQIAKLPGIGFEEAVRGSLQLQAVGVSAKTAESALMGFANAVARSGGSKADFAEALRQLTQIASAGKLTQENIGVIAERIPGFTNVIRQAFGSVNFEEINKQGLTSVQIVEKFAQAMARMPRATGGIRTALDNMADTLNFKLYQPLGRVIANLSGPFAAGLERLLTAAAPGLERMAKAAENLSKSDLGKWFASVTGNLQGLNKVISLAVGLFVGFAGARVAGAVVTSIATMITWFKTLRATIQSVTLVTEVLQAVATKGLSLIGAVVGGGLGIGSAIALNDYLNKTFKESDAGAALPFIPEDLKKQGGSPMSSVIDSMRSGIGQVLQQAIAAREEKAKEQREMQSRYLLAIERNTAKAADVLSLRRMTAGGGELAGLGVTAAELSGGAVGPLYAPPETFSRPVGSELERVLGKMADQRLARRGMVGRVRNA